MTSPFRSMLTLILARTLILTSTLAVLGSMAHAAELDANLDTLLSVGPNGKGHLPATRAWAEVSQSEADKLPAILTALDRANPLAANWIRTAVETIAERQLREGKKLPMRELESFVRDRSHNSRARRLAFEWIARVDPSASDRLISLDDPSLPMRRDAVSRLIKQAEALSAESPKVKTLYRTALTAARDPDQIKQLAERLRKSGEEVDLARHFGFLLHWKLIGPFDNTNEKGFDTIYPPEKKIDPNGKYQAKHGTIGWKDHVSTDDYGKVDFNKAYAEEKAVVGYATSTFVSEASRDVEIRITSFNAVKVWLNGKLIDKHNVYHGGSQLDQYVAEATLKPGKNEILIKVCQNEQTQSWARKWAFQLRVCDATGGGILSK